MKRRPTKHVDVAPAFTAPDRLLTTAHAAEYLDVQPQTMRTWRLAGVGPEWINTPPVQKGSKRGFIRYRLSDLEAWAGTQRKVA